MKKFSTKYRSLIFSIFAIAVIAISSCTPQKKLIYLQNKALEAKTQDTTIYNGKSPDYKLRPNDLIYVKINSLDPASFDVFNGGTSSANMSYQYTSLVGVYLSSYTVNDTGYVDLPVAGLIKVKDMTVIEAQNTIKESIDKYLKNASVIVKLTSFRVTIIGDVERPGEYYFYQDKVNIFEALSQAGDLTAYGNRYRVMLIRKSIGGDKVTMIDLTDRNLLNKEEYYILPNDVIYVEPNKVAKSLQFGTFPWSVVLSTVSTIATVYALIRK